MIGLYEFDVNTNSIRESKRMETFFSLTNDGEINIPRGQQEATQYTREDIKEGVVILTGICLKEEKETLKERGVGRPTGWF